MTNFQLVFSNSTSINGKEHKLSCAWFHSLRLGESRQFAVALINLAADKAPKETSFFEVRANFTQGMLGPLGWRPLIFAGVWQAGKLAPKLGLIPSYVSVSKNQFNCDVEIELHVQSAGYKEQPMEFASLAKIMAVLDFKEVHPHPLEEHPLVLSNLAEFWKENKFASRESDTDNGDSPDDNGDSADDHTLDAGIRDGNGVGGTGDCNTSTKEGGNANDGKTTDDTASVSVCDTSEQTVARKRRRVDS